MDRKGSERTITLMTEEALAASMQNDFEYRVLARDGSVRWLHDRGRFVYDLLDGPIRWQGVLFDITRLKEAEAEKEALIRQLQAALAQVERLAVLLQDPLRR